jgi:hypothetical protein
MLGDSTLEYLMPSVNAFYKKYIKDHMSLIFYENWTIKYTWTIIVGFDNEMHK